MSYDDDDDMRWMLLVSIQIKFWSGLILYYFCIVCYANWSPKKRAQGKAGKHVMHAPFHLYNVHKFNFAFADQQDSSEKSDVINDVAENIKINLSISWLRLVSQVHRRIRFVGRTFLKYSFSFITLTTRMTYSRITDLYIFSRLLIYNETNGQSSIHKLHWFKQVALHLSKKKRIDLPKGKETSKPFFFLLD